MTKTKMESQEQKQQRSEKRLLLPTRKKLQLEQATETSSVKRPQSLHRRCCWHRCQTWMQGMQTQTPTNRTFSLAQKKKKKKLEKKTMTTTTTVLRAAKAAARAAAGTRIQG
jgi:hypothetical protein